MRGASRLVLFNLTEKRSRQRFSVFPKHFKGFGQIMVSQNFSRVNNSGLSGAALGIITSIASEGRNTSPKTDENPIHEKLQPNAIIRRYYHQSLARELLPSERVALCHRRRVPLQNTVDVYKNMGTGKTYFKGLLVCGSLWHCPVCAVKISEGRRQELALALADAHVLEPDGSRLNLVSLLITYTVKHNLSMRLRLLLDGVLKAFRKLKSGRFFKDLKADYGWLGSVRALEVTYGDNGWHPHIHEVVLLSCSLSISQSDALTNLLKAQWGRVLQSEGLTASWDYGVDLRLGDKDVMEYIAKFGHEPKESSWTITHELTKGAVKKGGLHGRTPIELLADYGEGSIADGRLWQEYARVFKGRNQLVWSRGLRDLLGIGKEKKDGELSEENTTASDVRLAAISPDQWRAVLRADMRGELLVKASVLDDLAFSEWLADLVIRWSPAAAAVGVKLSRAADGSYNFKGFVK